MGEVVDNVKHEHPLVAAIKDIGAGSVGGALQVLVGHPLDTVKVRSLIRSFDRTASIIRSRSMAQSISLARTHALTLSTFDRCLGSIADLARWPLLWHDGLYPKDHSIGGRM